MSDHDHSVFGATKPTDRTEKPLMRDDGSKVATEGSPSGETETEKVRREESKLPNRGLSPDYDEPEAGDGSAVVDKPPQNEHDEQLIAEEFGGVDNDLVNVETFRQPAWGDDGSAPAAGAETDRGLTEEPASEKSNTLRKP